MKRILYLAFIINFTFLMSSCGTTASIEKNEQVAGYTLKNKKELLKHKILYNKRKTVIATP